MVTNQLMTAMETVCDTDCLMVAAKYGLTMEREMYRIVRKRYPVELPHEGTIRLVLLQHKRTSGSPIHRWLGDKIVGLMREWDKDLATDKESF